MIAKQEHHYEADKLRMLLDDQLPVIEARRVESHLSGCESCRRQLDEIAGERSWWDETVQVLSTSVSSEPASEYEFVEQSESIIPLRTLNASLDWIRPLLQPVSEQPATTHAIGRLDQYFVQGVIGQGGMGVVLRGIDPELNRPVAVKVLSPHLAGVGAARARFMREAQAAAAIVHPSIVPIYSVVPTARLPYIVMPCIAGGNLQQRLDREGPLELIEVLRIGLQIAEGLAAAHKHGVIHRDIKPANILIEEGNGRVLISDFGLARALDDASLTNSGMIAGTPQYMSPEQARGESVDDRSDLFSLGSLLYALATGRAPFRAETPLGVLRKITETRAKPIAEINERMPTWFGVLVSRFMEPELSKRIRSADDAATLLRDAHAHVRNPTVNKLPSSLGSRRQASRLQLVLLGLTFCLAIVAFTQWGSRPTDSSQAKSPQAVVQSSPPNLSPQIAIATPQFIPARAITSREWLDPNFDTELESIQFTLNQLSLQIEGAVPQSTPTSFQENKNDGISSEPKR